jgi:hypothetical protein
LRLLLAFRLEKLTLLDALGLEDRGAGVSEHAKAAAGDAAHKNDWSLTDFFAASLRYATRWPVLIDQRGIGRQWSVSTESCDRAHQG